MKTSITTVHTRAMGCRVRGARRACGVGDAAPLGINTNSKALQGDYEWEWRLACSWDASSYFLFLNDNNACVFLLIHAVSYILVLTFNF